MSCTPNTPVADDIRQSGWLTFSSIDLTTLTQYEPIDASVLTASDMCEAASQNFTLIQLGLREIRTTGAAINNDLTLYLYTDAEPTAPIEGTVYQPSTTNLIAVVPIVAADYYLVNNTTQEVRKDLTIRMTSGVLSTAVNIYVTGRFTGAIPTTYGAGATLAVSLYTLCAQTNA